MKRENVDYVALFVNDTDKDINLSVNSDKAQIIFWQFNDKSDRILFEANHGTTIKGHHATYLTIKRNRESYFRYCARRMFGSLCHMVSDIYFIIPTEIMQGANTFRAKRYWRRKAKL